MIHNERVIKIKKIRKLLLIEYCPEKGDVPKEEDDNIHTFLKYEQSIISSNEIGKIYNNMQP